MPNLNILKKFSGCGVPPGVSPPSPPSLPLSADAMLPFWSDCRKVSNVPSRVAAWWSSPTSEAAVAAAARESNRDSTSAWSSPLRRRSMLSMFSSSCHIDRRLREEPSVLRSRGSIDSARPSRLSELGVTGGLDRFESERSLLVLLPRRLSKSRSRSAIDGTCGSEGPVSLCDCLRAERGLAVLSGVAARLRTGSVLRELTEGRLERSPLMEPRELRARIRRDCGRRVGVAGAVVASSAGDEPASCARAAWDEKRWNGLTRCDRRRAGEGVDTLFGAARSSSGTLSLVSLVSLVLLPGCAGRPSSDGAHEAGRTLRRRCVRGSSGEGEPLELAWPMVRAVPAVEGAPREGRARGAVWQPCCG